MFPFVRYLKVGWNDSAAVHDGNPKASAAIAGRTAHRLLTYPHRVKAHSTMRAVAK